MRMIIGAVALAISAVGTVTTDAHPADYLFPRGLPHAPSEGECYSYRCVWDARHQGNGEGQSMILTRWRGGFIAKPITHTRAHRLQARWCARPQVTCGGYDD